MNPVIGDRFRMNNRVIGDEFAAMPRVSRPGVMKRWFQVASSAAGRVAQALNARNAIELDRVDLGSPDCMGCEAWIRDVEGEEAQRSRDPAVTDIDRIREAECRVERDIERRRVGALVFVLTMAVGLVGFAFYVSFSGDAPLSPVVSSASRT